jgi:hypothetical protein
MCRVSVLKNILIIHYHYHHVPEGLGVLSYSLILKMDVVPPN